MVIGKSTRCPEQRRADVRGAPVNTRGARVNGNGKDKTTSPLIFCCKTVDGSQIQASKTFKKAVDGLLALRRARFWHI